MHRKFLFTIIFLLTFAIVGFTQSTTIVNTSQKFEIVYLADGKFASDSAWLKTIRDEWKATGVNLRIFRSGVEKFDGGMNWNNHPNEVDRALDKIANAGLDIYLRVNLALIDIQDINKTYTDSDYHIKSNGKRFLNQYDELKRPLLNVTSFRARGDMLNFIQELVNHLRTLPVKIQNRIKLIVPTLSPDDETEFPFNSYNTLTKSIDHSVLSGFSYPEMESFITFLSEKYGNIDSLNNSWGDQANFNAFDIHQIRIREYNWDKVKIMEGDNSSIYLNGRKDFIDFRTIQLKRFIDDCSKIVKEAGFKFGIQFGSIYDTITEYRGFYDPTSLLENVDQIITADILEYSPNFNFSADFTRSLCNYWEWKSTYRGKIKFATEINWPGYAGHKPEDLIKYWSLQLNTFYEKGASALFVAQWGVVGAPNNTSEKVIARSFESKYENWKDTLLKYSNFTVKNILNDFTFFLPCEFNIQHIFYKNIDLIKSNDQQKSISFGFGNTEGADFVQFPLVKLVNTRNKTNGSNYYDNNGDFVTNYMLKESPDYLKNNYKYFFINNTGSLIDNSLRIDLK